MKLENQYASDLISKDKNIAIAAAKHIIETADMQAWKCFIENSDNIFDFIKQNIGKYFADVINENNYQNLYKLFKLHSFDWDECFIQILLRFSYENSELHNKMLDLIQNGSEDEKAYAAKYFSFVPDDKANYYLFEAYSVNYEPLKYNAAKALGDACDMYSYNYYLNKLSAQDDWEKVDAAQFLQWYGNKKAFQPMLLAMSKSTMPEHIAGSVAMLDNISRYFNFQEYQIRDLSLDCYLNLIDSLAEIWPLSTIMDFNIFDCVETLICLINQNVNEPLTSRFCALLLKTKAQFEKFYHNDEYKFNEDKHTIEAMESVLELLNEGNESFWRFCKASLEEELLQNDNARIIYALGVIADLKLKNYISQVKSMLDNNYPENVIYEIILTLNEFDDFREINKDAVLQKVTDPNLSAVISSMLN